MNKYRGKSWLVLLLAMSLVFCNGCSLVLLNRMQQNEQGENVTPGGDKQDLADNSGNEGKENNEDETQGPTPTEAPKEPSSTNGELITDYLTGKLELLEQVINMYYMDEISVDDLQTGIYKGLLEGLGDPYSCYYTKEEFDDLMESTSGTYAGIGAVVQQNLKTMYITVVKPYVDAPAYKAGMLPGDIIYMVDGQDVTGMEIDSVVAMMRGEPGTTVKVTVVRDGVSDPVELTITRAMVEIETVEYEMLDNKLGYILVSGFDELTAGQFKDAIKDLKKQGMEGLVIDLRDNPGGLLSAVVEMLDYILPEGMIVYTEDKYGERDEYRGTNKDVLFMPMVVMINGNSASASEIFAAAMQDYDAATILGTTSFGKGIVQSIIPFSDGTAVKVTVSQYFTPRGVCIHGTGVTPDIEVELNEELLQQVVIEHKDDNQLQEAIKHLLEEIKK